MLIIAIYDLSEFWITSNDVGLKKKKKTLLCVNVYHKPKYHKDFIREFSNFLSYIVPLSDLILIVGDFNIHVCF